MFMSANPGPGPSPERNCSEDFLKTVYTGLTATPAASAEKIYAKITVIFLMEAQTVGYTLMCSSQGYVQQGT